MAKFQEVGRVLGTHGLKGELRLECWCDSPEFLRGLGALTLNGTEYKINGVRAHRSIAVVKLEGVDSVERAQALKNIVAVADVSGVELPEGRWFVNDLMGLSVVDVTTGEEIGELSDVLFQPGHDVYVVKNGDLERMIPAVEAFVKEVDLEARVMRVALIEGL